MCETENDEFVQDDFVSRRISIKHVLMHRNVREMRVKYAKYAPRCLPTKTVPVQ